MQIKVVGDVTDLSPVNCNFVSEHAGGWYLDGVWPVVVVEAESVGEIQNVSFFKAAVVVCHEEVGRLHCSLSHRVRDQKKVKFAVDHFALRNESRVNVGASWWVHYLLIPFILEEPLPHSLVHNDEHYLG